MNDARFENNSWWNSIFIQWKFTDLLLISYTLWRNIKLPFLSCSKGAFGFGGFNLAYDIQIERKHFIKITQIESSTNFQGYIILFELFFYPDRFYFLYMLKICILVEWEKQNKQMQIDHLEKSFNQVWLLFFFICRTFVRFDCRPSFYAENSALIFFLLPFRSFMINFETFRRNSRRKQDPVYIMSHAPCNQQSSS